MSHKYNNALKLTVLNFFCIFQGAKFQVYHPGQSLLPHTLGTKVSDDLTGGVGGGGLGGGGFGGGGLGGCSKKTLHQLGMSKAHQQTLLHVFGHS